MAAALLMTWRAEWGELPPHYPSFFGQGAKCEVAHTLRMAVGTRTAGARRGIHGTEIKTSEVRICRRDGVDHPLGCDMGDGSAELVTHLPVGAFAFVLEFCVRAKRKAQSLIEAQAR
jgi:hypothetical protein